jgi:NADP-dependent 3-hydroxy acid dehydrogenase YdfG
VLVGRDAKKLESVAAELKGNTLVAAGDITKEEDVKAIFEKAITKFGTVDVVVNAAGMLNYCTIGETEPSQWWADHVSLS